MDSVTDAELVARCRAGDQDAWRTLVQRFSRYVYAIAVQGFRLSEHAADDVFQEVFARTYEHLDRLRDDAAIQPWLAQLTRRLCIDHLRASSREQLEEELEADAGDDTFERLDEALAVHEALAELPEHSGEILDRFFARDESYRTIGDALGLPAGDDRQSHLAVPSEAARALRGKETRPPTRLEVAFHCSPISIAGIWRGSQAR